MVRVDVMRPVLWRDEMRDPRDLLSHPRNPRTHSPAQIEQIRASIREFGFTNPALVTEDGRIIAGHGRAVAAEAEALEEIPVRVRDASHPLTEAQELALLVADNKIAENAGWDDALLGSILGELRADGYQLDLIGFRSEEIDAIIERARVSVPGAPAQPDPRLNVVPAVQSVAISAAGDVWRLGAHRLGCGDSTNVEDVARLLAGATGLPLLHADPPYGMGKEAAGIENDNLYAERLAAFQMAWWRTWRPFLADNASAYIWGNPEELWRLWYLGGLAESEKLTLRNEIVWWKGSGFGMNSDLLRQYSPSTERCLFFMLGAQGFGNVNKDDFWEGFEELRAALETEAKGAGFGPGDVKRITGVGMYGHWFSKSQWTLIPEKHYNALREAANGEWFAKPYAEIRAAYDRKMNLTQSDRLAPKHEFLALRAHFDNTHDVMTDVWEFGRVTGEERQGHATPKPVEMIERCIKSSARAGDVVLEPFAGSGSTLIAAEACGRTCYTMELAPQYVDVTIRRWQKLTGQSAMREADGLTFDECAARSGIGLAA